MRIMLSCFFFYGCHSKEQRDCEEQSITQEVCDGIDNDCDGDIDNHPVDGVLLYQDGDGDGFGSTASISACGAVPGFVENQDDCDDADVSIHPEAQEVCDGVDNDCDQLIDDADADLNIDSTEIFYQDADGDGLGTSAIIHRSCIAPTDFVSNRDDCDDSAPEVGIIDIDGDGVLSCWGDCDDTNPDVGATDMDNDGFIACVNDCDDSNSTTYPGAAEYDSPMACLRDVDNDGFGDFDPKECIILELFDSYGDSWNEGASVVVLREGRYDETLFVRADDDCESPFLCDISGGDMGGAVGYRAEEICSRGEEVTLYYQEGSFFDNQNSIRLTTAYGDVLEWGMMFDGQELIMQELFTWRSPQVERGTDCDDTDANIGTGDFDGDGQDACDEENPFDCDDSNPNFYVGAGYLEDAPYNEYCLLDEDGDGYAQRTSLFEFEMYNGGCLQVYIFDAWDDGCNGSVEVYRNGEFLQSLAGPQEDMISYEICDFGILQFGWKEASLFNVECSIVVEIVGTQIFATYDEIFQIIPTWGTDRYDQDPNAH